MRRGCADAIHSNLAGLRPLEERDETLSVMVNPARNALMLHNQDSKSKGETEPRESKNAVQT